jgi:hypothetical protein
MNMEAAMKLKFVPENGETLRDAFLKEAAHQNSPMLSDMLNVFAAPDDLRYSGGSDPKYTGLFAGEKYQSDKDALAQEIVTGSVKTLSRTGRAYTVVDTASIGPGGELALREMARDGYLVLAPSTRENGPYRGEAAITDKLMAKLIGFMGGEPDMANVAKEISVSRPILQGGNEIRPGSLAQRIRGATPVPGMSVVKS